MNIIKLKKIEFSKIPFRKLSNITLKIAPRITIISGHNGIGKSTILGFLTNASGFNNTDPTYKNYKSYLGKNFNANFHELFRLSIKYDYIADINQKSNVIITYDINHNELKKKCNITKSGLRLRVVPRSTPSKSFSSGNVIIGPAQKVPLPTIYLGMSRMMPIGEANNRDIIKSQDSTFPLEDRDYIFRSINKIIPTGSSSSTYITQQSIKHTKKTSKHPEYPYDSESISLGQDSLSSIVTALASFKKLKREMKSKYSGGLLVIDEIDAGFHPKTQRDIIDLLQSEADKLSLQILATTHSITVIEKIFANNNATPEGICKNDIVHYIQDTREPTLRENWNFKDIVSDMYLTLPIPIPTSKKKKKTVLTIYGEDDQAKIFFDKIIDRATKSLIENRIGAKIECLSMKMGHTDLLKIATADSIFNSVLLLMDGDVGKEKLKDHPNAIQLPTTKLKNKICSTNPEGIIYDFIETLYEDKKENHEGSWNYLTSKKISKDHLYDYFLKTAHQYNMSKRDSAKSWWIAVQDKLNSLEMIKLWAESHKNEISKFIEDLIYTAELLLKKNAYIESSKNINENDLSLAF